MGRRIKIKRAVSDEPIYLTKDFFNQLYLQFVSRHYPYKVLTEFKDRDIAICSTLVLSGVRASELKLKKKQFVNLEDRILLLNVKTEKHGDMRPQTVFPKSGILKEFTLTVADWLEQVPENDSYVFPSGTAFGVCWGQPLGRRRVFEIIKLKTGNFPHWLRGVHETYYGEVVFKGNAWKLARHMGLKRLDSTTPYVQSSYTEDIEERLFK